MTKKIDLFVYVWQEEFEARMSQMMSQTSSCSPSQSPEDPSAPLRVWADVVGGKQKGRLYGAGDLAANYKKGTRRLHIGESSSTGATPGRSAADKQELAELKRVVAEQQREAAERREDARRTSAMLAEVLQRQEDLYRLLARQPPPPPPSPPSDDGHDHGYQDY